MRRKHIGSKFTDWLDEEGIREQVDALAKQKIRADQSGSVAVDTRLLPAYASSMSTAQELKSLLSRAQALIDQLASKAETADRMIAASTAKSGVSTSNGGARRARPKRTRTRSRSGAVDVAELIALIKGKPMAVGEIAAALGVSKDRASRALGRLREEGRAKMKGERRMARWSA